MLVLSVVGARPQFVKAAVVSRALRDAGIEEVLVHTGQHYDLNMSKVFFDELEIPRPERNLEVGSASHGAQTGRMLEGLERAIIETRPDCVLVYGDTNSTLAGALAAAKLHVPIGHVEAGLRAYNRRMPEEVNRVLTDHVSRFLFVPSEAAAANLRREGIEESRIFNTGDVMYDAALHYAPKAEQRSDVLRRLDLEAGSYILATVHRAETTDVPERLCAVFDGLCGIAEEVPVVLPLHPRTRAALADHGLLDRASARTKLIDPVGYLDMLVLEKHARLVASDSGGVPKEAFFFGVRSVMLRKEAVWVELVELGWSRATDTSSADAVAGDIVAALASPPGQEGSPYGDGTSAVKVVKALLHRERHV